MMILVLAFAVSVSRFEYYRSKIEDLRWRHLGLGRFIGSSSTPLVIGAWPSRQPCCRACHVDEIPASVYTGNFSFRLLNPCCLLAGGGIVSVAMDPDSGRHLTFKYARLRANCTCVIAPFPRWHWRIGDAGLASRAGRAWVHYGIDGYAVNLVIDHTGPSNTQQLRGSGCGKLALMVNSTICLVQWRCACPGLAGCCRC